MNPEHPDKLPRHDTPAGDFPKVITDKFAGETAITPAILEALRSGDTDAYKALYNIAYNPLYMFILRVYPGFDAEDITQSVMAEVWEKRDSIDPARNFGAYLFRMAVSYANKVHRRRKVEQNYMQYAEGESHRTSAPDELLIEEQSRILYDIVLARMPARRRRIYELYLNEDMTYEEIAALLKVSRSTVEYNIRHARKELGEILALMVALLSI